MEDQEDVLPRYAIDLRWYQSNGIVFEEIVKSRLCRRCQERYRLEAAFDPLSAIAECCGDDPSFIGPFTPLAEALFRLFLVKANQPLTIAQLEEELRSRLGHSRGYRDVSAASLHRLLESPNRYGFGRVEQVAP